MNYTVTWYESQWDLCTINILEAAAIGRILDLTSRMSYPEISGEKNQGTDRLVDSPANADIP